MKSISVQAAIFALSIVPVAASAATVEMCGGSAAPAPYDVASGDLFNCDLTFTGASATNGLVLLDFVSSVAPLVALAGTVNLGLNSAFTTATLEWFDKPSNVSLGSVDLEPIMAGPVILGFGGALETTFSGPAPDEQYLVLQWTGFTGDALDVNIQVEEIAPVPLPAAAWLFLSAIAGVGMTGRLRKQV